MDCGKIRDQFSLLLEGGLKPPEEKRVKEHLVSCPACEKEWNEFRQVMGWLHSAGEEEVPDGFLSEIRKKLDERKGEPKRERAPFLRWMKIPIQATAMVAILFITLYLTRTPPFETLPKREIEKPGPVFSDSPPPVQEKQIVVESPRPAERPKAETPPPGEHKREGERMGQEMISLAKKSAIEMTLKMTNREKAISGLQDLVKGLGGELTVEEENVLLTSLPASSYAEFEKGFIKIGSSFEGQGVTARAEKKDALSVPPRANMRSVEEKEGMPSSPVGVREDQVLIRIRLSPE
jgi:hypothetical protein